MKWYVKLLLNAAAVFLAALLLPGVSATMLGALIAAAILGLLNTLVRPILVILTIPITVLTLGLFLIVINAIMVELTDWLTPAFDVKNFLWAIIFSIVMTIFSSILEKVFGNSKDK